VERFDYKLGVLAYLINHEQFEFYLEDAEIFMEEMLIEKMEEIKENMDELGTEYNQNHEAVQKEINFLILKKNFEKLKNISKEQIEEQEVNLFKNVFFQTQKNIGKLISIAQLNKECRVVENINREKMIINSHIEKMSNQITDAKTLSKMTEAAEKKLSSMIDINDFLYSLEDFKINESYNADETCEILGEILQKTNNPKVHKAIMRKAISYPYFRWSEYLEKDIFDFSDIEIAYYYNFLCKSSPNVKTLLNLTNFLELKPSIISVNSLAHLMECTNLCFSYNSKFIASSGKEKTVNITELETKQNFKYYHNTEIVRMFFSPNNKYLYSLGTDNSVKSFNLATKSLDDSFKQKPQFEFCSISNSGTHIFGKHENELKMYEATQRSPYFTFKQSHFIQDVILGKDDQDLISYTNYEVRIYNIKNPDDSHNIKTKRSINRLQISEDSKKIIIGMGDRWKGEIKIFESDSLKETFTLETDSSVKSVAISSALNRYGYILSEKEKSEIVVNDLDFNTEVFKFSTLTTYNDLVFWPETNFLIAMADYRIDIFDLKNGKLFHNIVYSNRIIKCRVSFDGTYLGVAVGNEVLSYSLLDIIQMSAYNILQIILSVRVEQQSESIELLREKASRFLNHDLKIVRDTFRDVIEYFS
jgi:WD40 repeat protein